MTLDYRSFLAFDSGSFVAAQVRSDQDVGYPFTRITVMKDRDPVREEHKHYIADIFPSQHSDDGFGLLFESGELALGLGRSYRNVADEHTDTPFPIMGRRLAAAEIQGNIFVVGDNGQFYRSGSDLNWTIVAPQLLNDPFPKLPNLLEVGPEEFFRQSDAQEQVSFFAVSGDAPTNVFLCGGYGNVERKIVHWNGEVARSLLPPRTEGTFTYALGHVVYDPDGVDAWTCGSRGALMRGNVKDGFAQVDGVDAGRDGDVAFYRLALWRDAVWLAGGEALYRYRDGLLSEVPTPDMGRGLHTVQATDDVLWVCSLDAIARFDGRDWMVVTGPSD